MNSIDVIFRAEKSGPYNGTVTAVFPSICADYAGHEMMCYAHIGQHSGCCIGWYRETRKAAPAEYAPLLRELTAIYGTDHGGEGVYSLRVVQKITAKHRQALRDGARQARESLRSNPAGAPFVPVQGVTA